MATLPNGDVVLAAGGEHADAGFSIGGTKAIRAPAVVLGRLDAFRRRTAAKSSVELLEGLTRWIEGRSDCIFNGRCVIAGTDRMNSLTEPSASLKVLRRTVDFSAPGKPAWTSYQPKDRPRATRESTVIT